jgi:hypothetical protein
VIEQEILGYLEWIKNMGFTAKGLHTDGDRGVDVELRRMVVTLTIRSACTKQQNGAAERSGKAPKLEAEGLIKAGGTGDVWKTVRSSLA